jgi:hypothetical protein
MIRAGQPGSVAPLVFVVRLSGSRITAPRPSRERLPGPPLHRLRGQFVAQILYRIVAEVPGSYAVEVTDRGTFRHFESGFPTEAEAEAWAAEQAKATRGIDQWEPRPDPSRMR